MQIGAGSVNAAVVLGVADKNRGDAGSPCAVHIQRSVTQIPHRVAGSTTELIERKVERRGVGLVGGGVSCADHGAEMGGPAEMCHFGPQEAPGLVGDHRLRERCAGPQRVGGSGHRMDVLQVLFFQRGVEQVAGVFPVFAKGSGERLADRDAGTPAGVLDRPKRQVEGGVRGVEGGCDASPRVNKGVVPVVQKSGRAGNGKLLAAAVGHLDCRATRGHALNGLV